MTNDLTPFRSHVAEVTRRIEAMEAERRPAERETIIDWLQALSVATSTGTMGRTAIEARMDMIVFALGDRPAFCWTERTLRDAALHFKAFFPTVGELADFLDPIAKKHRMAIEDARRAITPDADGYIYHHGVESRVPYDPGPAPARDDPRHFDPRTVPAKARDPVRTPEEQIRLLGLNPKDYGF